jgi:hypothetical protein
LKASKSDAGAVRARSARAHAPGGVVPGSGGVVPGGAGGVAVGSGVLAAGGAPSFGDSEALHPAATSIKRRGPYLTGESLPP